jgi:hypothetical protein
MTRISCMGNGSYECTIYESLDDLPPALRMAAHKACTSGSSFLSPSKSWTFRASWTCARFVDPQRGVMSHLDGSALDVINPRTIDIACTVSARE